MRYPGQIWVIIIITVIIIVISRLMWFVSTDQILMFYFIGMFMVKVTFLSDSGKVLASSERSVSLSLPKRSWNLRNAYSCCCCFFPVFVPHCSVCFWFFFLPLGHAALPISSATVSWNHFLLITDGAGFIRGKTDCADKLVWGICWGFC